MRSLILDQIEENAMADPDAVAYVLLDPDGSERVRYTRGALWKAARGATAVLASEGVREGDICALMLRHHPLMAPTYLGVAMLGALPAVLTHLTARLHPEKFRHGLRGMAAHSGLNVVITEPDIYPAIEPLAIGAHSTVRSVMLVREGDPEAASKIVSRQPSSPFLLQHSSGTTGLQKAVVLSNQAILGQVASMRARSKGTSDDVVASWLPLYHDMGLIGNFIIPLVLGQAVYQLDPVDWVAQPASILKAISRYRATLSWMPNFAFAHLASRVTDAELDDANVRLDSLRMLVNAAEPVRPKTIRAFLDRFARWGARPEQLGAVYGMAEVVLCCSMVPAGTPPKELTIDRVAFEEQRRVKVIINSSAPAAAAAVATIVSCGPALDGCELRVVDSDRRPMGADGIGEIAVRSEYLFDGYHRAPEKTAAVLRDGWLYSGDLGFIHDGEVYIVGRLKDLIIVRGRNIAPEDLEFAASAAPGVLPGRVIAFGLANEAIGTEEVHLLAEIDEAKVPMTDRNALATRVVKAVAEAADVTVRVHFVPPRWLIKSSAGKPARLANIERFLRSEHLAANSEKRDVAIVPPRNEAERALAKIWTQVLNVTEVGVEDELLSLGGDSIKAATIASLATTAGLELSQHEVLQHGTIAKLAVIARRTSPRSSSALPPTLAAAAETSSSTPLSSKQMFNWIALQLGRVGGEVVAAFVLDLEGPLDTTRLLEAFSKIVERQESLRLTFRMTSSGPVQEALPHLPDESWFSKKTATSSDDLRELLLEEMRRPFAYKTGPAFRVVLVALPDRVEGQNHHQLLFVGSHLVVDGWSFHSLCHELFAFYDRETLPPINRSYLDHVRSEHARVARGDDGARQKDLEFWKTRLAPPIPRFTPTLGAATSVVSTKSFGAASTKLSPALAQSIARLVETESCTMFTVLFAAYAAFLARHLQTSDVWLGVLHANRDTIDQQKLVGQFANMVIARIDLSIDPDARKPHSFRDVLKRARTCVLEGIEHRSASLDEILRLPQFRREREHMRELPVLNFYDAYGDNTTPIDGGRLRSKSIDVDDLMNDMSDRTYDLLNFKKAAATVAADQQISLTWLPSRGWAAFFSDADALRDAFVAFVERAVSSPDDDTSLLLLR